MTSSTYSHTDHHGDTLNIMRGANGPLILEVVAVTGGARVMTIEPLQLLAMIDTIDPDAMRGYLRERSEYLDSPHDGPWPAFVEDVRSGRFGADR